MLGWFFSSISCSLLTKFSVKAAPFFVRSCWRMEWYICNYISLNSPWAGFIKSSQQPHLASLHGVALSQPLKFKPFARVKPSGQQPYLGEESRSLIPRVNNNGPTQWGCSPHITPRPHPDIRQTQGLKKSIWTNEEAGEDGDGVKTCCSVLKIRTTAVQGFLTLVTHEHFLKKKLDLQSFWDAHLRTLKAALFLWPLGMCASIRTATWWYL